MKNRYKVLIIVLSFLAAIVIVATIVGLGFHTVGINQYGYAMNRVYGTILDSNVFTYGNYFIGIDHQMVKFPSGLIKYDFTIICNTVDKSFLTVEVLFLGQLVPSQLSTLNLEYGVKYNEILKSSIEQTIRQTLQQFTLVRILSERSQIEGEVASSVQQSIQTSYPFINVRHVSLGAVGVDLPNTAVMTENPTLYELQLQTLNQSYQLQKQINFLNVSQNLLAEYETYHSSLFSSVMSSLNTAANAISTTNYTDRSNAATYMMSQPIMKGMVLDKVYITL